MEHLIPTMPERRVEMEIQEEVSLDPQSTQAPPLLPSEDPDEYNVFPTEEDMDELELPPLPEKRPKLRNDEVFKEAGEGLKVAPVKKEKKEKKKRVMTPEALENLAKARQKAFENKRLKKLQREKQTESIPEDIVPDKFKKVEKVEPPPPKVIEKGYTQEDLIKAVSSGVETYDRKRKAEKLLKKERLEKQKKEMDMAEKIQRAVNPQVKDPWDFIFR
jgi:hypothetical protein